MHHRSAPIGLCLLIALLLCPAVTRAEEERPRIAVLSFRTNEALDEALPGFNRKLRDALRHHLKQDWVLVPTEEVEAAIVAAELSTRAVLGNDQDAAKLAAALSVRRLLVGHASGGDDELELKARVLDAETGAFGEWATILLTDPNQLWDGTRPLLEDVGLLPRELTEGPAQFLAQSHSERARIIRRQFRLAGKDVERLKLLHAWLTEREEQDGAERCVDLIEEQQPGSEWVAARRGRVDLRKTYARIPEDDLLFDHPNRACEELERMQEYAPDWGTLREQRKAERLIAEVERHLERLKSDERYLEEFGVTLRVEKSPQFGDRHFQVRSSAPFLLFIEHEEYASPDRVAAVLESADLLLSELHATWSVFRETFSKELDLPELEAQKSIEDRLFKVFLFQDEESFAAFHENIDDPSPLRLLGPCYEPRNQWLLAFPAPDEGSADSNLVRIRSAAARQIFALMRKLSLAEKAPEAVLWSDPRLEGKLLWFELGLPAMIGAGAAPDRRADGGFAVNEALLAAWRSETGGIDFDIMTMMEIEDIAGLRSAWSLRGGKGGPAHALALFEAQAWALCDYFWHTRGTTSRKGLLKYLRSELKGETGAKALRKAYFGSSRPRWTNLEEQWRKWVLEL